ncbi:hypothetical protein [Pseudoruegeria sp. HB172150]|uniref:Acb2/Tad1 domain-containing protein n=1 Tax=Pseudoruegeria sp. HB172150 TaxID=2721164 RepID=UPI0015532E85|nr:hypothetical protein [Pseudoruegeria sp. HB172150]
MQTLGEYRVGTGFNPTGDELVDRIKAKAAALIDLIGEIPAGDKPPHPPAGEIARLKALAMTAAEEAAVWAVKAATKPGPGNETGQ